MFFDQLIGQLTGETINIVTPYPTALKSGVKKES